MSYRDIYDFERAVETGLKAAFTAQEILAWTSQDALVQQRPRPHVVCEFILGGGEQRYYATSNSYSRRRESAWGCTINLSLITDAEIELHSDYRAKVRSIMAQIWVDVNASDSMTRHNLQIMRENGASQLIVNSDGGYFRTDFSYAGKISVQADAWAALNT